MTADRWVRFRFRDLYIPEPAEILFELHGDDTLEGRIVAISESNDPKGRFAVVEIAEWDRPVIVPEARLLFARA